MGNRSGRLANYALKLTSAAAAARLVVEPSWLRAAALAA